MTFNKGDQVAYNGEPGIILETDGVAPATVYVDFPATGRRLWKFESSLTIWDFFVPRTVYIENAPYRAPELLYVFECVAVTKHPRDGSLRALGFAYPSYPGRKWAKSVAYRQLQWEREDGWVVSP